MILPRQFNRAVRQFLMPVLVVMGVGLAWGVTAWAQEVQPNSNPGSNAGSGESAGAEDGKVTRDQVLAIMSREVVLAPGVGLRNLRLGEPLVQVQNRLGPPAAISRSGIISNIVTLNYLLDSGTEIAVSGRDIVEKITVRGNSAGLVRTAQGARFGMESRIILRIYREPSRTRRNRLEYAHRGITFEFEEGVVTQMDLYPRTR